MRRQKFSRDDISNPLLYILPTSHKFYVRSQMKIWNINKAACREIKYVNLSSMSVFKVTNII